MEEVEAVEAVEAMEEVAYLVLLSPPGNVASIVKTPNPLFNKSSFAPALPTMRSRSPSPSTSPRASARVRAPPWFGGGSSQCRRLCGCVD